MPRDYSTLTTAKEAGDYPEDLTEITSENETDPTYFYKCIVCGNTHGYTVKRSEIERCAICGYPCTPDQSLIPAKPDGTPMRTETDV